MPSDLHSHSGGREGGREEGRERGRERGREGGREGEREGEKVESKDGYVDESMGMRREGQSEEGGTKRRMEHMKGEKGNEEGRWMINLGFPDVAIEEVEEVFVSLLQFSLPLKSGLQLYRLLVDV